MKNKNEQIILSTEEWKPAFSASPEDMLRALTQQFPSRELTFRELGQNSQDAAARKVYCTFLMETCDDESFIFVTEWMDDGCGMNLEVIQNNYLDLLHSSKDHQNDSCVGRHGAGRLAIFAIPDLITQETVTVSEDTDSNGYMICMTPDGTGEVLEMERDEALMQLVAGDWRPLRGHGTLVRVKYRLDGSKKEFAEEVEKIVKSLQQELRWLRPKLTVTTVQLEKKEGEPATLKFGSKTLNHQFGIPGRMTKTYPFELANSLGSGTVSVGITPDGKNPMPDLTALTLTSGGIPLERATGVDWRLSGRSFYFTNMRVVIESFQWHPPIGRHRVRHDAFYREVIPKVFENIIMQRYIPWLTDRMSSRSERRMMFGYLNNLETMFFDLLCESRIEGFDLPKCVRELPLFRQYGQSWERRAYSVQDLEKAGRFYFTTRKPELADWREAMDGEPDDSESENRMLDLSSCSSYAVAFLVKCFGSRAELVNERFFVKEDKSQFARSTDAALDESRIERYLPGAWRKLRIGRFLQLGGDKLPETGARSYAKKDGGEVYLNANNTDVLHMMQLANQTARQNDQFIGLHFLLREALLVDGLDIGERERRSALQQHAASRGVGGPDPVLHRRVLDILKGRGKDSVERDPTLPHEFVKETEPSIFYI